MKISKIKNQIRHLAKDFYLKYNPKWFNFIWIKKEEEALLKFILGCPRPDFNKFGKDHNKRMKNIRLYINSKIYKQLSKEYGGEVVSKKSLDYLNHIINTINDKNIKRLLKKIIISLEREINNSKYIALLTKTNNKFEKEKLKSILLHEWIHILLDKNNIGSDIDNYNWKYNEGLVTYLTWILENKNYKLEDRVKNSKSSFGKHYYSKAIEFRNLLKNIKTPEKRKQAILNLYKRLK